VRPHLHVRDVVVARHQLVAHLDGGLEGDARLLHGDHRVGQADGIVARLEALAHLVGLGLCVADVLQRHFQCVRKADLAGRFGRVRRTRLVDAAHAGQAADATLTRVQRGRRFWAAAFSCAIIATP